MYQYLLLFCCTMFWYLDGINIVHKNFIRLKKLNNFLISYDKKNNICKLLYIVFSIIFRSLYISFIQKINRNVKKLSSKKYEITTIIDGKIYKFFIKPKRGPSNILQIIDDNDNDVTDEIIPYIHNIVINPEILGYSSLTFNLSNGDTLIYENNTDIIL